MSINDKDDGVLDVLLKFKNVNTLKNYVKVKKIKLKNLYTSKNTLLSFIENNASLEIINYIIINGKYFDVNYEYYRVYEEFSNNNKKYEKKNGFRISPLGMAIKKNNFELADYFLRLGGNVNYIRDNSLISIINKENWEYILNKGYYITSSLIHSLIKRNKNYFLYNILKYISFHPSLILFFIDLGRNKIPLSDREYKDLISPYLLRIYLMNKQKPLLRKSVYRVAVNSRNYEALGILYRFDPRNKKTVVKDVFELLNTTQKRKKWINYIESKNKNKNNKSNNNNKSSSTTSLNELNSLLEKYYPEVPFELEKAVLRLIKNNCYDALKSYVKKYHIQFTEIINKNFRDVVDESLRHQVLPQTLDFVIDQFFSEDENLSKNFDYENYLFKSLSVNNLKAADFLIEKFSNRKVHTLFFWFHNEEFYTPRILNFIMCNIHRINIFNDYNEFFNLDDLQKEGYAIFNRIVQKLFFNNIFILKLLSLYQNETPMTTPQLENIIYQEKNKIQINRNIYNRIINSYDSNDTQNCDNMLNLLYKVDCRDKELIINEIFGLIHLLRSKNSIVDKIKKGMIKIPMNESILYQLKNSDTIIKSILKFIDENNISGLKRYLDENHIMLNDLKRFISTNDFLCYAIERQFPSMEMINFILRIYDNLNFITKGKNPLSCALAFHHFNIVEILIDHGANINYGVKEGKETIFDILQSNHQLSINNVKFMLNHGLEITSDIVYEAIKPNKNFSESDSDSIDSFFDFNESDDNSDGGVTDNNLYNDLMKTIFKYYIYDNSFIIKLINHYKNKIPLSNTELNELINKEKNKIYTDSVYVNDEMDAHYVYYAYYYAIENLDYVAIDTFIEYEYGFSLVFADMKSVYKLLLTAIASNNDHFINELINSSNFIYFSQFNVKTFFTLAFNDQKYTNRFNEVSEIIHKKNSNYLEIEHDDNLYYSDNSEKWNSSYNESCCLSDSDMLDGKKGFGVLFNNLLIKDYINFKLNNFETVLLIFISKLSIYELNFLILNSLQSKTFTFEKVNFNNILYHLLECLNTWNEDFIKTVLSFIEKAFSHETFNYDYTKIDIKKSIMNILSVNNDPQYLIIKCFLKELMKCKDFSSNALIKEEIIQKIELLDNIELSTSLKKIIS